VSWGTEALDWDNSTVKATFRTSAFGAEGGTMDHPEAGRSPPPRQVVTPQTRHLPPVKPDRQNIIVMVCLFYTKWLLKRSIESEELAIKYADLKNVSLFRTRNSLFSRGTGNFDQTIEINVLFHEKPYRNHPITGNLENSS
jgi:hypothetical protein